MRRCCLLLALAAVVLPAQGAEKGAPATPARRAAGGVGDIGDVLRKMGHRNWVVVADSAYPWQTAAGIETVYVGGDLTDTLKNVLGQLAKQKHVRPVVYLDRELDYVDEAAAPGVGDFRERLKGTLGDLAPRKVDHEKIIDRLDKAGSTFHILLLKTDLAIPYTSVFIELDCGYWGPDAEKALRERMKAAIKTE